MREYESEVRFYKFAKFKMANPKRRKRNLKIEFSKTENYKDI